MRSTIRTAAGTSPETEVAQLRQALESRDAIGQAKGILRLLLGLDADGAFGVLAKISTDTNRKVRDVSVVIADCAAAGRSLPADVARSWQQRTGKTLIPAAVVECECA